MKKHLYRFAPPLVAIMVVIGVAVHDTKLDTFTKFMIALPVLIASYESAHALVLATEAHTHVERVSIGETAGRFTTGMPKTAVRHNEDKKYRLSKAIPKGHHPFDNYNLPIVA